MKHIEQQIARQQAMTTRVSSQNDEASEQLTQLQQQYAQVAEQFEAAQQQVNTLRTQLQQQQQQTEKQQAIAEKRQAMLYEAYQHQHRLKARKDTLEELKFIKTADFSGFYQGVKAVLQARVNQQLKGDVQ